MPKSRKRKAAAAAAADFKKGKKRVGRKQAPENATKTEFRTRSVKVASQNLSSDIATGLPGSVSARQDWGKTLEVLLNKLGHYNANMRRNALAALLKLLSAHPEELGGASTTLLRLMERLAPCCADDDEHVRTALMALLGEVIRLVSPSSLAPFAPLLMVHTASAMTHLDSGVRAFSLELLDLWQQYLPAACLQSGSKILGNLLLLIAGERSTMGGLGSAPAVDVAKARGRTLYRNPSDRMSTEAARMGVLRRIHAFLGLAVAGQEAEAPAAGPVPAGGAGMDTGADGAVHVWTPAADALDLFQSGTAGSTPASTALPQAPLPVLSSFKALKTFFIEDLLPVTLECWLGMEPASFDRASTELRAGMLLIVQLCGLVTQQLHLKAAAEDSQDTEWRHQLFQTYQKYFMTYFPFGDGAVLQSKEVLEGLLHANLEACAVLITTLSSGGAALRADEAVQACVDTMVQYLAATLDVAVAGGTQFASNSAETLRRPKTLRRLVQVMEGLVELQPDAQGLLVDSLLGLDAGLGITGQAKVETLAFLCARCLGQPAGAWSPTLAQWARGLPKLLWKLKANSVAATRTVLDFVRVTAARGVRVGAAKGAGGLLADELQAGLCLFFWITIRGTPVFGPFLQLPVALQEMALDTVAYVAEPSPSMLRALAQCLHTLHISEAVAVRCVDNVLSRFQPQSTGSAPGLSPQHLNFFLSALVGYSQGNYEAVVASPTCAYADCALSEPQTLVVERSGKSKLQPVPAEERARFWHRRLACAEQLCQWMVQMEGGVRLFAVLEDMIQGGCTPLDTAAAWMCLAAACALSQPGLVSDRVVGILGGWIVCIVLMDLDARQQGIDLLATVCAPLISGDPSVARAVCCRISDRYDERTFPAGASGPSVTLCTSAFARLMGSAPLRDTWRAHGEALEAVYLAVHHSAATVDQQTRGELLSAVRLCMAPHTRGRLPPVPS